MPRPLPFHRPPRPAGPTVAPTPPSTSPGPTPALQVQGAFLLLASDANASQDSVGWHDRLSTLRAQGLDLNAIDQDGRSPLHVAAWKANQGLMTALLDQGARADRRDRDGATPLVELLDNLLGSSTGEGLIERMVHAGADPNGVHWPGWTRFAKDNLGEDLPLGDGQWLNGVANGQPVPLDMLVPTAAITPPLTVEALQGTMTRVIASALKSGRVQRTTPLLLALRLNDHAERRFEELLAVGADPLASVGFGATTTLLHEVVRTTPLALIDRLLDLGVPPHALNGNGQTPLQQWGDQPGMESHVQRLALRIEQQTLRRAIDAGTPAPAAGKARPRL